MIFDWQTVDPPNQKIKKTCRCPADSGRHETGAKEGGGGEAKLPLGLEGYEDQRIGNKKS